jgi:N-acetylmuramoyl-L-alanine amidase
MVLKRKTIITTAFVAILFLFSLFCAILGIIKSANNDSITKVVVIDPGHGGIDGGATFAGVMEKDVNLYISQKLKFYLEKKGFGVIMTRDKDISLDGLSKNSSSRHQRDLDARANIINSSNAKLFLSIHVNCHLRNLSANSAIVFYSSKNPQSKVFADDMQKELNSITFNGNKRFPHESQEGNYFILNNSDKPGIIIETAFISNDNDRNLLKTNEFKDELARTIAAGVENYFSKAYSNTPLV